MAETPPDTSANYDGAKLREEGQKWLARIKASEKREESWRKDAEAAEKAYSCDARDKADGKLYDFNILHSNVETIVPAIYNSTPVPDVRSRDTLPEIEMPQPPQAQPDQQPDPRAVMQYQAAVRQAQQQAARIAAVKDYGRLIERAITVQIDDNKLDTEVESAAQDAFLSGRGIVRVRMHADDGGNERLSFEAVSWRDFRRGPAKRWEDIPWMSFRHTMPLEEAERFGDKEMLASQATDADAAIRPDEDEDCDIVVWEIWCREPERYVKFIRESDGKIMRMEADPLGLGGFFPIPAAIQPIALTGNLTPVCPFTVYRKLADELDLITRRINAIMKGLKVRGLVAGDAADISNLAQAGDNELVTASNLEGLAQTRGLDAAILWWPIEQATAVLKELYVQREQIKQAIYELTGISDIVRGASNAGETATAQQIKTQWGSLRIQKMQRLVQRMVRDLFIISAEIITTKFSPQTLQAMTGIEITPDIQALMANKVMSRYRVDVESDSTVRADTTRVKGELTEFMAGTGQYFATMGPLLQAQPKLAEPVAEIYSAFTRVFNLGKQAEDALDRMVQTAKKAGQQPPANPEKEKLQAEMEMKKAELGMDMQRLQAEMQGKQVEARIKEQSEAARIETDRQRAQIDLQKAMVDLEIRKLELDMKAREMSMGLQARQAETAMKLDAQRQSNEIKAEQARQQRREKTKQPA